MGASADGGDTAELVRRDMCRWIESAVIGLNLCPFARAVHMRGQIHYAVCSSSSTDVLAAELESELKQLVALPPESRETTLLIAPFCLDVFDDFNDFLVVADRTLSDLGLEGVIQIASFHPHYHFAGTSPDDMTNHTNRAPYPTLHLLREDSVQRAVDAFPKAESIYERNMRTMETLGPEAWSRLGIRRSVDTDGGAAGEDGKRGSDR